MKILNIHGYHGNAENSAYYVLKDISCNVISPALDYDSESPDKTLEKLFSIIQKMNLMQLLVQAMADFLQFFSLSEANFLLY